MKIEFDNAVLAKLAEYSNADLVLDLDNTFSAKGQPVDSCTIGSRFRLIAIDKDSIPDTFDVTIETNFAPIHLKKYGQVFLEKEMTLDQSPDKRYQLKSHGELMDSNVEILDYRTEK